MGTEFGTEENKNNTNPIEYFWHQSAVARQSGDVKRLLLGK